MSNIDHLICPFEGTFHIQTDDDYIVWRKGTGSSIEIVHLYVADRRKGRGTVLLKDMATKLKDGLDSVQSIFGFTRSSNECGVGFYRAMGFDLLHIPHLYEDETGTMFVQSFARLLEKLNVG